MTRSEAREQAFILVFEKIFNPELTISEMKDISAECELFILDSFAGIISAKNHTGRIKKQRLAMQVSGIG